MNLGENGDSLPEVTISGDETKQPTPIIPHAGKRHLPALDGIRGVAAISVFLYHYGDLSGSGSHILRFVNEVKLRGAYGVDIFFALSGFLITGILWDTRDAGRRWLNFYCNRGLRLFPLYYGIWAFIAVYCVFSHYPWHRSNYAYLLYAGNFVFPFPWLSLIGTFNVSHFWSLACEEQFYMIWPVVVWRIRSVQTLQYISLIAFGGSIALKLIAFGFHINPMWQYALLPLHLEGLCAGAFCALVLRTHPERTVRVGRRLFWILAPVAFLFFVISTWLQLSIGTEDCVAFGLVGATSAALITTAVNPASLLSRFFSTHALRMAGRYSYGIYVYSVFLHNTFKTYVLPEIAHTFHGRIISGVVYLCTVICLTMLISIISFHLLEQPFLKLKRHERLPPRHVCSYAGDAIL
jgi:peptidoglycan/LPS O-acetylase OafA/YrhL